MPSVFLSHSHGDKPFVRDLAGRLSQAGAAVWLDEAEMNVGESLIDRIAAAIQEVDYVAAILSPRSVKSNWVQKELSLAMAKELQGRRVTVLPVLIEACDLPEFLRDKLYADFTRPENHEREFARLLKAMRLQPEPIPGTPAESPASPGGEDTVYLVRRSMADQVADLKRERKSERFSLVQDDRGIREYSRQEVDKLTATQRVRLFAADPEMEAWWRGRSPTSGAWPLFRVKGGIWLAKQQIDQTPREHHADIFEGISGLLDWYMENRLF